MNIRESIEALTEKVDREQLCASEIHCLLLESLKCPDWIADQDVKYVNKWDDINDRIAGDWVDSPPI